MKTAHPTEMQIRARAYEIYCQRGCRPGHPNDDWLQAEYELRQLPVEQLVEIEPIVRARGKSRPSALVSLVQAAVILGIESLQHFKG